MHSQVVTKGWELLAGGGGWGPGGLGRPGPGDLGAAGQGLVVRDFDQIL